MSESLPRATIDFDGSVLITRRHAEGMSLRYDPRRKGTRSDDPLFCTLSQLGMSIDMLHRSGHAHDSNGAVKFDPRCIERMRRALPRAAIELISLDQRAKNHAQATIVVVGLFCFWEPNDSIAAGGHSN